MSRFNLPLFLTFLFLSTLASAQNYPERDSGFVNDFANILDDQAEQRIIEALSELKQSRDVEMKLVTIDSISDYGFDGEIEPFATGLFNFWGIGDATRNDGILMLIAIKDRAMRIELGAGYPAHLDRTAKTIIDEIMIPQFKNGNYVSGIEKGVYEASHLMRLDATRLDSPLYSKSSSESPTSSPLMTFLQWAAGILASIFGSVFGIFRFNKWRRERPRHCPKCQGTMELLPDHQEDAHLSTGQQSEERVNSIQYDVWYCTADETVQICDYQKWFSGYCNCKFCNNKTLGSSSETIRRATEYNTGTSRVTFTCEHCKESWTELHTIPRVTPSSSSSSSGSSGGRSSGGGASGRW
jgi:uncharacterized protein